jgi:hypothetical protein
MVILTWRDQRAGLDKQGKRDQTRFGSFQRMEFPESPQKPVAYQSPRQKVIERLLAFGLIAAGSSIMQRLIFSSIGRVQSLSSFDRDH